MKFLSTYIFAQIALALLAMPALAQNSQVSFIFKHSERCADVSGSSQDNNAALQQNDCHGGDNQTVSLNPKGNKYYEVKFKHSGKCMDVWGSSRDNNATLQQYDCHGGDNQLVSLNPKGNGYYEVKFKHSGKCVDVWAGSRDNNAKLQQYDCHGGDNQLLKIKEKTLIRVRLELFRSIPFVPAAR